MVQPETELPLRLDAVHQLPAERYPSFLKLLQVQVIHRHGPRTPLGYRLPQFYPFAWPLCAQAGNRTPHPGIELLVSGDEKILNGLSAELQAAPIGSECTLGQLTDHGRDVMRKLGESLKALYIDRLGLKAMAPEIHLKSTNFPRTIESLHAVLTGLFPKHGTSDHRHQSLQVLIRDEYLEDMYGSTKCQAYKEILTEYANYFAREAGEECAALRTSLPHLFNVPDLYGKRPSTYGIWDTLYARQAHGLSLPAGVDDNVMTQLDNLAAREWFQLFTHTPDAIKFTVGRFIRELDSNLYRRDRRLCIYSAHDTTVSPLLVAFSGGELTRSPPFGCHIALELFESQRAQSAQGSGSERYVRVLYNNLPIVVPHCALPGNHLSSDKSLCRLEAFSQAMRKFIPENYLKECDHPK